MSKHVPRKPVSRRLDKIPASDWFYKGIVRGKKFLNIIFLWLWIFRQADDEDETISLITIEIQQPDRGELAVSNPIV